MQSINVTESISQIQKKMDDCKRELLLLEGSLAAYNNILSRGVTTIYVPDVIVIKDEPIREVD
jgi:hypothetical protein